MARALAGRIDAGHVAEECAAQLARLGAAGVRVTHIDSHRHVHALPGVWAPVVATARTHGVPFVRVPVEHGTGRGVVKRWTIAAAWAVAARGVPAPRPAGRCFCTRPPSAPTLFGLAFIPSCAKSRPPLAA